MRWLAAALTLSLTSTACSPGDSVLPAEYQRLAVPEERLRSAEAQARGRALYESHCALCHGPRGDGRGARAAGFARPAADLTSPAWRARTTPRRAFFVIREGLRATPMPGWKGALDDQQIWDVVAYVLSLSR